MFFLKPLLKSQLKCILVLFFSLFLWGCTGWHQINYDPSYNVEQDKNYGLVVISITHSGANDIPYKLHYRNHDKNKKHIKGQINIIGIKDWQPTTYGPTTSKSSYQGRVVVLKLPPGQYEFYDLIIEDGYQEASWYTQSNISIPFISTSGNTEYAGNFHIWSQENNEEYGLSYEYYHSDERIRDLDVLRNKFPNIKNVSYSRFSPNTSLALSSTLKRKLSNEEFQILLIEPKDSEAHKNRAIIYIRLKEYGKARYHINKALALDTNQADAYTYSSIIYLKNKNLANSLADANRALQLDPQNAMSLFVRSLIYKATGKEKLARTDYSKAIKLNPTIAEKEGILFK